MRIPRNRGMMGSFLRRWGVRVVVLSWATTLVTGSSSGIIVHLPIEYEEPESDSTVEMVLEKDPMCFWHDDMTRSTIANAREWFYQLLVRYHHEGEAVNKLGSSTEEPR